MTSRAARLPVVRNLDLPRVEDDVRPEARNAGLGTVPTQEETP